MREAGARVSEAFDRPGDRGVDRDAVAAEIDEELTFHLEVAEAAARDAGLDQDEASATVARAFGDVQRYRDACLSVASRSSMMKKKWTMVTGVLLVLAMVYVAGLATPELLREIGNEFDGGSEWARVGAFEGIEWRGDTPIVLVDDRWYALEQIHGRDIAEVLAHSEAVFEERGRKRVSEDLHEVLLSMGLPGRTLDATLRDLSTGEVVTRCGMVMDHDTRQRAKYGDWQEREDVPRPPESI